MRLSLQSRYAICGIFDLAYHAGGGPAQVRVIGERQQIPCRYLEQIFQKLRRAGLVRSKRGPGGGYTLAGDPRELTLRDVVEAIEGPLRAAEASRPGNGEEGEGSQQGEEGGVGRPDFLWPDLAARVAEVLEGVSVESLCREAARRAVARAGAEAVTYQI